LEGLTMSARPRQLTRKPWFHAPSGLWCAQIDGKRHYLDREPTAALRKLKKLLQDRRRGDAGKQEWLDAYFSDLADEFLDDVRARKKPQTYEGYQEMLTLAQKHLGTRLRVGEVRKLHLAKLEGVLTGSCSSTTVFKCQHAMQRVFSWAVENDLLDLSPLAGYKKPKPRERTCAIHAAEFQKMLRGSGAPFRRLLAALRRTGARPCELRDLRWQEVHLDLRLGGGEAPSGFIILPEHKTVTRQKHPRPRIIPLPEPIRKLLLFLGRAQHGPDDHVFRNADGRPWTRIDLHSQMRRLRERVGLEKQGTRMWSSTRTGTPSPPRTWGATRTSSWPTCSATPTSPRPEGTRTSASSACGRSAAGRIVGQGREVLQGRAGVAPPPARPRPGLLPGNDHPILGRGLDHRRQRDLGRGAVVAGQGDGEGPGQAAALDQLPNASRADAPASRELTYRQGLAFGPGAGHGNPDLGVGSTILADDSVRHQQEHRKLRLRLPGCTSSCSGCETAKANCPDGKATCPQRPHRPRHNRRRDCHRHGVLTFSLLTGSEKVRTGPYLDIDLRLDGAGRLLTPAVERRHRSPAGSLGPQAQLLSRHVGGRQHLLDDAQALLPVVRLPPDPAGAGRLRQPGRPGHRRRPRQLDLAAEVGRPLAQPGGQEVVPVAQGVALPPQQVQPVLQGGALADQVLGHVLGLVRLQAAPVGVPAAAGQVAQ
jgi:integrase